MYCYERGGSPNFIMDCHNAVRVLCLTSSLYHCSRILRNSAVINNNFLTMVEHDASWELDPNRKRSVEVIHLVTTESRSDAIGNRIFDNYS